MNSMSTLDVLTWSVIIAFIYAIITNRLMAFGGSQRTIVLELGARILEDPETPPDMREMVKRSLRLATSVRAAWMFVLCIIPVTFFVLKRVPRNERKQRRILPEGKTYRPHYWDAWTAYSQALVLAVLSNSPLAMALYYVQITIASMIVWPHIIVMKLITRASDNAQKHHSVIAELHGATAHKEMAE